MTIEMTKSRNAVGRILPAHKLAIGYVRVSTLSQGEDGISLEAQRKGIQAFADHAGYTLIETFEDVSSGVGSMSFYKREGLRRALELADREGADLIVWDWDRLSRHTGFEIEIKKIFPERDRLICAKHGNVLSDAAKAGAFAHPEAVAGKISRSTKKGMDRKRKEGTVFGNPDIRTNVQPLGAVAWSISAENLAHQIADILRGHDSDPFEITHAIAADILNEKCLRTLHGKKWDKSRIRGPLKKARALLNAEDEDEMRSQPLFGMF